MKPISFILRSPLSPVVVVTLLLLLLGSTSLNASSSTENDIDDDDQFEVDTDIDDDDDAFNYDDIPWDKLQLISSGSGDFEEPEYTVSEALGGLIDRHEKAMKLERQYKDLERFKVYSEYVSSSNQQGKDTLDKIKKLGDRLETLMAEVKTGKLSAEQYKSELIDVDREKKELHPIIDDFSDNATAITDEWIEFAEKWNTAQRDWAPFIEEMKDVSKLIDIARNASVRLVNIQDDATKGFAGGKVIDFDVSIVIELKGLFEELEKLEDRETADPKEFMKMIEEIEEYQTSVIDEFLKANHDQLGRFMPSLGAAVVRTKLNHMIATNVREVWEQNQEVGKEIYRQMIVAYKRYEKIVEETAVVLKSVLKDEL